MRSLKLLGGAALLSGDRPVTGRGVHRRRLALLARLAVERGSPVPRERLTGCLWAEHPQAEARHLLSESLYQLRKELDEGALVASGDAVALDPRVVPSDVDDFERAVERGELAEAVGMYRGPLLDGFYVADAPEFEHWMDGERDRLARAYAGALERLAEQAQRAGDVLAAAEWWRRLTVHDPYSPRIALRLVRALDAAGERPAALRHAAAHALRLRTELEVEPDEGMEEFVEGLRAAPPRRPVKPPAPPAAPRPALRSTLDLSTVDRESAMDPGSAPRPASSEDRPAADGGSEVDVGRARPGLLDPAADSPGVDRFRGASADGEREPPTIYRGPDRRRPRGGRMRSRPVMLLAAAGALVVVMALTRPSGAPANVERSAYVVLPFAGRPGGEAVDIDPDEMELTLHDALGRWTDLPLVDRQATRLAVLRQGGVSTLGDALRVAERLGAGTLVWGELAQAGDSVVVRGHVYEVARGAAVRGVRMRLGPGTRDLRPAMERLAEALLSPGRARDEPPGAGLATSSMAAWRAYAAGRKKLDRWDLSGAGDALDRAAALDPGFAPAQVWRAQAAEWAGATAAEWSTPARLALRRPGALPARERALARALVAMSEGRHPDACAEYGRALARDSADFAAWYGLGECHAHDPLVVRDPRSRTGWRFRGSYRRAAEAYGRALAAAPAFLETYGNGAYPSLAGLLMTEARSVRTGRAAGADGGGMAAYPALDHDTLAFFPLPAGELASRRAVAASPRRAEALVRSRAMLREVLDAWVRASPRSPSAHEALSGALEAAGELDAVRQGAPSAMS
ncbi:MAG: protein kinase, partial [Gemmatimonadetes bacterium]|nr:protein kinase [Gemmatimonadota bacterium]